MIIFAILMVALAVILTAGVLIIGASTGIGIIVFSDVIVAALLIYLIFFRKKKKK